MNAIFFLTGALLLVVLLGCSLRVVIGAIGLLVRFLYWCIRGCPDIQVPPSYWVNNNHQICDDKGDLILDGNDRPMDLNKTGHDKIQKRVWLHRQKIDSACGFAVVQQDADDMGRT